MKILDRFLIIVFNICLTLVGVWISLIPVAKSENSYHIGFKICDMYSSKYSEGDEIPSDKLLYNDKLYHKFDYIAGEDYDQEIKKDIKVILEDEQIDLITKHLIDYLFGTEEEFGIKMNVKHYAKDIGFYEKEVDVFGLDAIRHMNDVKNLLIAFQIVCVISFVFGLGILAYLILRIGQIRHIVFEYTMFFHAIFFTTISILFMIVLVSTIVKNNGSTPVLDDFMLIGWTYLHYLFFPFQPDKIEASVLADILPELLDTRIFIMMTCIVIISTISLQVVWLIFTLIVKIFGGQIGNKIKQKKYSSKIITE